jgi:endonuclease YncB( thermonuclease family)
MKIFVLCFLTSLMPTVAIEKRYDATVLQVIDGDTVDAIIELGLDVSKKERIRLDGIDSPEMNTPEGKKAKDFLEKKIKGRPVILVTYSDGREKYGRLLAEIIYEEQNINNLLVQRNLAKPYDGGKR